MYIDTHVHLRDCYQEKKETIKHGLEVARDSGLDAIFEEPNTNPAITTREVVLQRLRLVKQANVPEVMYGMHIGLTPDLEQVKRAVDIYREFHEVVGMKLFAGESVGDLEVIDEGDQYKIFQTLAQEGYTGVLQVHAEKEAHMHRDLWDPYNPISHCHARPEESEIESGKDIIRFAKLSKFQGKLHFAHTSSPGLVALVNEAKADGMDVSCGVCPHHFIYDWKQMNEENGMLFKMNPPLRSPESRAKMFEDLKAGKIDWLETDHAPHQLNEKLQGDKKSGFMSGIPGLPWWPLFEEYLRRHDFTNTQIEKLTFTNAAERYDLDIDRTKRPIKDRRQDYPFNPYTPIEKLLGWKP